MKIGSLESLRCPLKERSADVFLTFPPVSGKLLRKLVLLQKTRFGSTGVGSNPIVGTINENSRFFSNFSAIFLKLQGPISRAWRGVFHPK